VTSSTANSLQSPSTRLTPAEEGAIRHLKEAIASGKHWYLALLEAIGLWQASEETIDVQSYQYLIESEAFDWLVLAERLLREVDRLVPEAEKEALLFHGRPPLELSASEFRKLIGNRKYHQYLNYFYGITAEEALLQTVEEEVRKEGWAPGRKSEQDISDEAYRRIYGATQPELLRDFRRDKSYPRSRSIGLTQLKEFTYWLFKYRLKHSDKARVASDTKKALRWLKSSPSHRQSY
jgi:hypothetical protein